MLVGQNVVDVLPLIAIYIDDQSPMLEEPFTSLLSITTPEDLLKSLVRLAGKYDFEYGSCMYVMDNKVKAAGPSIDNVVQIDGGYRTEHSNNGSIFGNVYYTNPSYAEAIMNIEPGDVDPVMQHAKHSKYPVPLLWDHQFYRAHGAEDKYEMLADSGLKTGIVVAMHLAEGNHICVGLDGASTIGRSPSHMNGLIASITTWTMYAIASARQALMPGLEAEVARQVPKLTGRPLEALKWTMEGKSAWEVGQILSISESTVVKHLIAARSALDVGSTQQAVVQALRMGLIS